MVGGNRLSTASSSSSSWNSAVSGRSVDDAVATLEPVMQALLGGGNSSSQDLLPRGVLMLSVQSGTNGTASAGTTVGEPEAIAAVRALRRQTTQHHVTLAADNATWMELHRMGALQLWDSHMLLHPEAAEIVLMSSPRWRERARQLKLFYAWKMIAQAASPYQETVFIDNDVLVLSRTLISDLLERTLHVSDLAFVQDPARPPAETFRTRASLASARVRGAVVSTPGMYSRGLPPLCTCVMAYRRTTSVRRLLHRATARLFLGVNLHDISMPLQQRTIVRQSDQEMMWFQLATGEPDPRLRLFVLPEEYYCPAWYPAKGKNAVTPFHYYVKSISGREAPTWTTRWGSYDCHAVHMHHSHQHLEDAKPRIKDTVIEKFEAALERGRLSHKRGPGA